LGAARIELAGIACLNASMQQELTGTFRLGERKAIHKPAQGEARARQNQSFFQGVRSIYT
jgi:hypothetical protein